MHRINKGRNIILLFMALFSCIKPFEPDIEGRDQALYVVSGQVTDREGYQYVSVSISSDVNTPTFIPARGCQVEIENDLGTVFSLEEMEDGTYRAWMEGSSLTPGRSYRVRVITPTGEVIRSSFDKMNPCPDIDDVYYELDDIPTNDPEIYEQGIRFFVDLDATGYESRYFRWEVEETYEYHMDYAREWYFDGTTHKIDPPDKSTQVCWYTGTVSDIFTVSTSNLEENIYKGYALHFVNSHTHKLTVMYSALLKQYALSQEAYAYWDKLRVNSQGQGGLYEQQPLPVDGNLHMPSDPDKRVLGFFGAAAVTYKRVFIESVEGLEVEPPPLCIGPVPHGIFGWADFDPNEYPIYFVRIDGAINTLVEDCLDCRRHGGVTDKPEFWPE
jgi:hypothetical protein